MSTLPLSKSLSISAAPELIRKALCAGKNVISEKPIAPTMRIAEELIHLYRERRKTNPKLTWVVGENFWLWRSVERAGSIIRNLKCKIPTFNCRIFHHIDQDNKYFHSDWRQGPKHPADVVLDSGIHFVALLRYLFAANGQKISMTTTHTKLLDSTQAPMDSVFSLLHTDQGVSGQFSFSLGIPSLAGIIYEIITDQGNVCVDGPAIVITIPVLTTAGKMLSNGHKQQLTEKTYEDPATFGVPEEFALFEAALQGGELDARISIEEALADLHLLEAMVQSGEQNGLSCRVG